MYGLSTPTLGRGGWSIDIALMARRGSGESQGMLRPMLSYGLTEDLQLSLSWPVPLRTVDSTPQVRVATRMPSSREVEALVGWRFQRRAPDVGSRFESTLYAGVDMPTARARGALRTSPGLVAAAVTGFASRSVYAWAGAMVRRYAGARDGNGFDRLGDVAMYSLVLGYRPEAFRRDPPHPDWRLFLEVVGEVTGRDRVDGAVRAASGGHRLFAGPTVLGLYGSWGVSGGPVFPMFARVNGVQPREGARLVVNTTWWF